MAIEKERRFLVRDGFVPPGAEHVYIRQGYLCTDPDRTIRVRQVFTVPDTAGAMRGCDTEGRAFLTVKGRKDASGAGVEVEFPVPFGESEDLLHMCVGCLVEKERFLVRWGHHTVEVDVFCGENEGLVIAEVERDSETFVPPDGWDEVTADPRRWSNAALSVCPYRRMSADADL